VNFLGFKCVSGKTVFVGYPEGDGFLFGNFGKKFHEIKIQMNIDGIILLQPGFNENRRANYFLTNAEANKLTNEDALIQDEVQLSQLNDEIEIDKMITTPIIQEKDFMNKKLEDEISGNDYKEVVNQNAREWILKDPNVKEKKVEGLLTVGDALEEIKQLEGGRGGGGSGFGRKKRKKKRKNNKKWNGQIVDLKNIKPLSFLKNKDNYIKLKERIRQEINEEFSIKDEYFASKIGQSLIKQVLLDEKPQKKKKKVSKSSYLVPDFRTKIKSVKSKKMNGEVKIVKFNKKSKSVQKPKTSTVEIAIEGEEDNNKNLYCSDALYLKNILEKMNEANIAEFLVDGTKARAKKTTDPREKWIQFGNKIRKTSISLLLQTIGQIIRGMHKLVEEIDTGKKMPIKEKLNLYKLLDDNEKILEFLSTKEDKEEEDEEILTPSEHPERITSLNEMETKLSRINNLLADKNLKPEEKKKLEQLKNLYLQQKIN
jgi:hypothetical protein